MTHPLAGLSAPDLAPHKLIETTVSDCALKVLTLPEGLQRLHVAGLKPDRDDFEDAVESMRTRDGLIAGSVDPYTALDMAPSINVRHVRDYAIASFDEALKTACLRMQGGAR